MITKICNACGKEFKVKPYRKDTARFCSCRCWTTSQESKKIVSESIKKRHQINPVVGDNNPNWKGGHKKDATCLNCGIAFVKRKDSSSNKDFCSIKCHDIFQKENPSLGKDSPNWKGGKIPRQITAKWRKLRLVVIKRDNYKCANCGSSINLCVHHIVPVRNGGKDTLDNLVTVCNICHPTVERRGMGYGNPISITPL